MLVRDNIRSTGNWLWQKQLRCYLSKGIQMQCVEFVLCVCTFKIIVLVIFTTILPIIIITQDCSNHRYFDVTFIILNQWQTCIVQIFYSTCLPYPLFLPPPHTLSHAYMCALRSLPLAHGGCWVFLHLWVPGQCCQAGAHTSHRQVLPHSHSGHAHGAWGKPLWTSWYRKDRVSKSFGRTLWTTGKTVR